MVTVSAHSTVHLGTVSDLTEHTTATLDRILTVRIGILVYQSKTDYSRLKCIVYGSLKGL